MAVIGLLVHSVGLKAMLLTLFIAMSIILCIVIGVSLVVGT